MEHLPGHLHARNLARARPSIYPVPRKGVSDMGHVYPYLVCPPSGKPERNIGCVPEMLQHPVMGGGVFALEGNRRDLLPVGDVPAYGDSDRTLVLLQPSDDYGDIFTAICVRLERRSKRLVCLFCFSPPPLCPTCPCRACVRRPASSRRLSTKACRSGTGAHLQASRRDSLPPGAPPSLRPCSPQLMSSSSYTMSTGRFSGTVFICTGSGIDRDTISPCLSL